MAENSGIAWTDNTQNFWVGCTAVSPACDNCYADALVTRYGGDFAKRRRTAPATWRKALSWDRKAKDAGQRKRVFTLSLGDFWDNQVPPLWRVDALDVIRQTESLDWLVLTKRPQNIIKMLAEARDLAATESMLLLARWLTMWIDGEPPGNVWLGATAENQTELDRRVTHLRAVPAAVRFLSCEPLLGPLDLGREPGVDWVIVGYESGPGYRAGDPGWARSIRDQCAASGTSFFMKQMWGASQRSMVPVPADLMVRDWPRH